MNRQRGRLRLWRRDLDYEEDEVQQKSFEQGWLGRAKGGGCGENKNKKEGEVREFSGKGRQAFVAGWMLIRARQREITRSWSLPSMTSCLLEPQPRAKKDSSTHTHRSYEAQQGTSSSRKQKHWEAMPCKEGRGEKGSLAATYSSKRSLMSWKMPSQTCLASKAPSALPPHLPPTHWS